MTFRETIFFFITAIAVIYSITKSKPDKEIEYITLETTCICETFDEASLIKATKDKGLDDLCPLWADENEYTHVDDLQDVCADSFDDLEPYDRDY